MKATERRIQILEILSIRRKETVDNLAFEFGVANSTIRNDLLELSCNYPIYTTQGNGGGVHVVEGYYIGRKYLKPQQQELLDRLSSALNENDSKTMSEILKSFALPNKK